MTAVLVQITVDHRDPDFPNLLLRDQHSFIDYAPEFPISQEVYESYHEAMFWVRHLDVPDLPAATHDYESEYQVQ